MLSTDVLPFQKDSVAETWDWQGHEVWTHKNESSAEMLLACLTFFIASSTVK